jgi:hypothetical protein
MDGLGRQGDEACLRAHIDNLAAALFDHDAPGGLTGEESALEVDREGAVEVLFANILSEIAGRDAGVVHENVKATEVLGGLLDAGFDLVNVGHVHLQREHAAAAGGDLGFKALVAAKFFEADGDVGSGFGECEGDGTAEATSGAGDQGDLAVEIKRG